MYVRFLCTVSEVRPVVSHLVGTLHSHWYLIWIKTSPSIPVFFLMFFQFHFFSYFKCVCGKEPKLENSGIYWLFPGGITSTHVIVCLMEVRFPSHKANGNLDSVGLSFWQCVLFALLCSPTLPELSRASKISFWCHWKKLEAWSDCTTQ